MATKQLLTYPAIFNQEDDGYWVEFIDLKGCYTEAEDINFSQVLQEALKNKLQIDKKIWKRKCNKC